MKVRRLAIISCAISGLTRVFFFPRHIVYAPARERIREAAGAEVVVTYRQVRELLQINMEIIALTSIAAMTLRPLSA